jgi:hypothetical protein
MRRIFIGAQAVFAEPIDPNLHTLNQSRKGALHGFGINREALRIQTFQMTAALTVKMRMGRMERIGPQTVNKRSPAAAEPLDQTVVHKKIEDPINRHPVYRCVALQGLVYITGGKREIIAAQNFQYAQAVFGNLEFTCLQKIGIITLLTHLGSSRVCTRLGVDRRRRFGTAAAAGRQAVDCQEKKKSDPGNQNNARARS